MEAYERQFASLRQCCSGTASDLSSFEAKTLSILKRLEEGGVRGLGTGGSRLQGKPEGGEAAGGAADQRAREQARFDTNRIVAILKEHEQILMDGFDRKLPACAESPPPVITSTVSPTIDTSTIDTGLFYCVLRLHIS